MTVTNPNVPWAIVLCALNGTKPDPAIPAQLRDLIITNPAGLSAFWRDQSLGTIDLSKSDVFGWFPCGWSVRPSDGGAIYPGIASHIARPDIVAHARSVLEANVGYLLAGAYRGIIAVYNFSVDGGNSASNVAYGLNGLTSPVDWAEAGWRRCTYCHSMISPSGAGRPCTNSKAAAGHSAFDGWTWAIPTDSTIPQMQGGFAACSKCGCLFDTTAAAKGTTCAAGGGHASAAGAPYFAMQWADPLGPSWDTVTSQPSSRDLYVCGDCHILTSAVDNAVCPATGNPHALGPTELSVAPVTRYAYNRTFLAHEMGHAYGFVHGLGWQVQSTDSADDCLPGAYGDSSDIMSAMICDFYTPTSRDPDAALGIAGPGLALHHLVTAGLLDSTSVVTAPTTADGTLFTLRPGHRTDLPGVSGVKAGSCLIELRENVGWDRALHGLTAPDGSSVALGVAIYDMTPVAPTRLLMPNGQAYLQVGESFERRSGLEVLEVENAFDLSLDNLSTVRVEFQGMTTDPPSATLRVTNTGQAVAGPFQRWLVLRCAYLDGVAPDSLPDVFNVLTGPLGVEEFWTVAANGAYFVAGADQVVSHDPDGWIWIPGGSTADQSDGLAARTARAVKATLALKGTTGNHTPLYLDYRNFTGLLVVRNVPLPEIGISRQLLPSGNALPMLIDCPNEKRTGIAAGDLTYDVIEVGTNHLTHAHIAAAIGQSLGLSPSETDPYDVMGPGSYSSVIPTHAAYGSAGPRPSTETLKALSWLPASRIAQPEGTIGAPIGAGYVTLGALRTMATNGLPVRAEIGPYSFELRTTNDAQYWDWGLPAEWAVIARTEGAPPTALGALGSVTWGSATAVIGGGFVKVLSIDTAGGVALLQFASHLGRRFIAGGEGDYNNLYTYINGRVTLVPKGDPWGGELVAALRALERAVERIARSEDEG